MKSLHVGIFIATLVTHSLYAASFTLSGSVISDNQKMITSRYMGYVKEVRASEGDRVKKGDVLYVIDSKEIDSAAAQAELSIAQAKLASQMYENQHQNARLNLERYQRLYTKDMVSKYDVENLELAEKNLQAMLEISKQQIQQAEQKRKEILNQYHYLKVTAPNNSVVIAKNIKVGEMAMPGIASFVLSDLSNLKIATEISESNLKDVQRGKEVRIEIPSMNVQTKGTIDSIIPSSNPMTHTFQVKITFEAKEAMIYPGMYALVHIGE